MLKKTFFSNLPCTILMYLVHVKKISRHITNTCAFYQIEYLSYCIFSINTEINMYKDPSSLLNRKKKMK